MSGVVVDKRITEVLEEIRAALLNSQDIDNFCQTNYGKSLKVFLGADERDLPEISNCPFVLLDRGSIDFSEGNTYRDSACEFYLFIAIYQEQTIDDGRGVVYSGINEIDELSQMIRQEICNSIYPVLFEEETVIGINPDLPLRRYPVYMVMNKAIIRPMRERRSS
ncbi:MAG TPA: hypothetical protein ENF97_01070 [Candidatus Omnitrophica bacterium]|nr:hypothetical protein [Candidatus Omnitrophota bacterium]